MGHSEQSCGRGIYVRLQATRTEVLEMRSMNAILSPIHRPFVVGRNRYPFLRPALLQRLLGVSENALPGGGRGDRNLSCWKRTIRLRARKNWSKRLCGISVSRGLLWAVGRPQVSA